MYDFYPLIGLAEFFVHSFDGCRMEAIGTFSLAPASGPTPTIPVQHNNFARDRTSQSDR